MLPFNPFSALTSKIFGGLAAVLLLALAVQTARIEGFLFIDGYKEKLEKRDTALAGWKVANDAAIAWATAEQHRAKIYDTANQEKNDAKLDSARAATRPVLDAYAAANRCVRSQGPAGLGADLPGAGGTAQSADRAGGTPGVYVAISEPDLRICADNTLRLETGVSWAADYAAGPAPVGAGAPRGAFGVPE